MQALVRPLALPSVASAVVQNVRERPRRCTPLPIGTVCPARFVSRQYPGAKAMMSGKTILLAGIISFATAAYAEDANDRNVEQYMCKDIIRESGSGRDNAIAFLHGYLVGKSGGSAFNLDTLAKQTDAFVNRCLDNPNEKAIDAMTKVKA
jgi:hypothetical protein